MLNIVRSSNLKTLVACAVIATLLAFLAVGCLGGDPDYDEDWEEGVFEDLDDDVLEEDVNDHEPIEDDIDENDDEDIDDPDNDTMDDFDDEDLEF